MLVESGVVVLEGLIVGEITGSGPVEHCADQSGVTTTNSAGGLDVLGRGLGLAGSTYLCQSHLSHRL